MAINRKRTLSLIAFILSTALPDPELIGFLTPSSKFPADPSALIIGIAGPKTSTVTFLRGLGEQVPSIRGTAAESDGRIARGISGRIDGKEEFGFRGEDEGDFGNCDLGGVGNCIDRV